MAENNGEVPATKLVVNVERLKEILVEKDLKNWEQVRDLSKEKGSPIALGTLYGIVGGGNFQKGSLERLAEVLNVGLEEFVEFHPASA